MEQLYTLQVGAVLHQQLAPETAFSVTIQNNTGQWYYSPTASQFIPPYTINAVISFPSGTQVATLQPQTPPNQLSVPVIGEQLEVCFSSKPQVANSGSNLGYGSTYQNMSGTVSFQNFAALGDWGPVPIGFLAYSVTIQNLSGAWFRFVSGNVSQYIPPYTVNVQIPLTPPQTTFTMFFGSPAGQIDNLKSAPELIRVIAFATVQPATQGVSLAAAVLANPLPIFNVVFSYVNTTGGPVTLILANPAIDGTLYRVISYDISIIGIPIITGNFGGGGIPVTINEVATALAHFDGIINSSGTAAGVFAPYSHTNFSNANDSGLFQTLTPNSALIMIIPSGGATNWNQVSGHLSYIKIKP